MFRAFYVFFIFLFLNLFFLNIPVYSQEQEEYGPRPEIYEQRGESQSEQPHITKYATGNWGGVRSKLEDKGIILNLDNTNDTQVKLRGGTSGKVKTTSIDLINYAITVETEKLGLFKDGEFYALGQTIIGHDATELVGAIQDLSSLEAPNITQVGEFWYKQSVFNKKLTVKVGKQDASKDFNALTSVADFVNSSFTLDPDLPLPAYPSQNFGFSGFISPVKLFNIKAGIFGGQEDIRGIGLKTFFEGNDGYVTIVEMGLTPNIRNHPGNYLVGYLFDSGNFEDNSVTANPRVFPSRQVIYSSFEQMLYKEKKDKDDIQGLTVFGQMALTSPNGTEVSSYYGVGSVYKGLLPKRDDDILGVGMALVTLRDSDQETGNGDNETVLDMYYKARLKPWLALQPDVQIVFKPGGSGKTAVVLGIRSIINF